MNDAALIQQILNGQQEHYETLLKRYMGLAQSVCASHVRYQASHDDIIQDSFIHAYTKLGKLRNQERFGPWLCTIVRNKCRDWLRKHKKSETLAQILSEEPPVHLVTSPEDALMREELREWLRGHLARLPESTREAMSLCYIDGFEQNEAADFLGVSLSALKKRLQYGRTQLSERIWGELEHVETAPKKEPAALSGAIMMTLPKGKTPSTVTAVGQLIEMATGKPIITVAFLFILIAFTAINFWPNQSQKIEPSTATPHIELSQPIEDNDTSNPSTKIVKANTQTKITTLTTNKKTVPKIISKGINGIVLDKNTNQPIPEVEVLIQRKEEINTPKIFAKTITEADGTFSFPELTSPKTGLHFKLGAPYHYGGSHYMQHKASSQPVKVNSEIIIHARKEGSVSGIVQYPDGKPAPFVEIKRSYKVNKWSSFNLATTDEQGRYAFFHDGGIWEIRAEASLSVRTNSIELDLNALEHIKQDFTVPRGGMIRLTLETGDVSIDDQRLNMVVRHGLREDYSESEHRFGSSSHFGFNAKPFKHNDTHFRKGNTLFFPNLSPNTYTFEVKTKGFETAATEDISIDESLSTQQVKLVLAKVETQNSDLSRIPAPPSKEIPPLSPQETEVTWIPYVYSSEELRRAYGTFNFSINASTSHVEIPTSNKKFKNGNYWFITLKDGYPADIKFITLINKTYTHEAIFGESGIAFGNLSHISKHTQGKPYIIPFEIWEDFKEKIITEDISSKFFDLAEALAQGPKGDESGDFTIPYLSPGWYVAYYDSTASKPFEIKAGHETGLIEWDIPPETPESVSR